MRMKLYLMLAISLIVMGGTALAQDDYPKIELFGGYAYMRTAANTNINGWSALAAYNANKYFGIAADLAAHYQTESDMARRSSARLYSFLFGPQFTDRAGRIAGFAHFLIGVASTGAGFNIGRGNVVGPNSHTGFSFAVGGGINADINERLAVRLFSLDYQYLRYPDPRSASESTKRDAMRLSIGLIYKIQ
jgi:opacity protein-like surface antigen